MTIRILWFPITVFIILGDWCMYFAGVEHQQEQPATAEQKIKVIDTLKYDEKRRIAVDFVCQERGWKGANNFCGQPMDGVKK